TLAAANLALQAGSGIGTSAAMAIDAANLAFASQNGPINISDASTVTLTGVGPLSASSIPGDVYSSATVGSVYTLLHSVGGIHGQISSRGQPLLEEANLTLADHNRYQISYRGNGGHDVTLTRVASLETLPPPNPAEQFVAMLYRTVLGRAADEAGLSS